MSRKQKSIRVAIIPHVQFNLHEDWWKKRELGEDECLYLQWSTDTKMELRERSKRRFEVTMGVQLRGGSITELLEFKEGFGGWPFVKPLPYGVADIPERIFPRSEEEEGEMRKELMETPEEVAFTQDAVEFCMGMVTKVLGKAPEGLSLEKTLRGLVKMHNTLVDRVREMEEAP